MREDPRSVAASDQAPGRLLVVDDNELNRDMLSRRLLRSGHAVVTADDGRQALERLREEPFDVVLLDIMMPEMDGYEVLETMMGDPELRSVRVIMISAVDEIDSVVRCLKLGADDYLPKPFEPTLLAARLASSLARKRLQDRIEGERRSMERELEIGRRIQAGFLPSRLPAVAGWEIAATFEPARQVAGDFYDVFGLTPAADRPRLALVVGDVCDKGVGAALFMALFRTLLRLTLGQDGPDLSEGRANAGEAARLVRAVTRTNDYIARTHGDANMFATLFVASLDPTDGSVCCVNAGHEAPVVVSAGGELRRLQPTGPAVGLMEGLDFVSAETTIAPGETLVAITDGVTEAKSETGELWGEERLDALLASPVASAQGVLDQLVAELSSFVGAADQSDDLTLLAVRRLGG